MKTITSLDFYRYYLNTYCLTSEAKLAGYTVPLTIKAPFPKKVDQESLHFLDRTTFTSILKEVNTKLRDVIIFNNFQFEMPGRLGSLAIRKKERKVYIDDDGNVVTRHLPVDWGATNKLWAVDEKARLAKKVVKHTNPHTQGFIVKWQYHTGYANFKNKSAYTFKPCRDSKLALVRAIKENNKLDFYLR